MLFWIIAFAISAAACLAIGYVMLQRSSDDAERPEMQVFRDQLAELDRDTARGLLSEDEAERLKTEVARRIILAGRDGKAATSRLPAPVAWTGVIVAVAAMLAGTVAIYGVLGAPGYPDLPLARRIAMAEETRQTRPDQTSAEAAVAARLPNLPSNAAPAFLDLMEKLRESVAARPDDLEGLRLLARNEAVLGNFAAAADAQERIIALTPEPDAEHYVNLTELYVAAANGYVSPEAERGIVEALQRDARNQRARYFAGLLYTQLGRPDLAFRFWSALLEEGPETAPWYAPIRAEIVGLARLAGVDYEPPVLRGPSSGDIAAAADLTESERADMIRGMVEGLAERLANEGGTASEWARLIGALGVLGETDRAAAIWGEAQQVFAGNDGLEAIREAARAAGVE